MWGGESVRPDLDAALVGVDVADYVEIRLGEFDYAFLLQFFDGLDYFCRHGV